MQRNPNEDEIVERALAAIAATNAEWRAEQAAKGQSRRECAPVRPPERRWPPTSINAEGRFAKPHAKLFPFIGRKVRTPAGPGTLLQVFADRITVLLESELEKAKQERLLNYFTLGEIEPVSWELG